MSQIIGKTKSGKLIYDDINHNYHHKHYPDANDSSDWDDAFKTNKNNKNTMKAKLVKESVEEVEQHATPTGQKKFYMINTITPDYTHMDFKWLTLSEVLKLFNEGKREIKESGEGGISLVEISTNNTDGYLEVGFEANGEGCIKVIKDYSPDED